MMPLGPETEILVCNSGFDLRIVRLRLGFNLGIVWSLLL
jgi:hypothetical protein